MGLFFITFDLESAEEADYELVYRWAHRNEGVECQHWCWHWIQNQFWGISA